MNNNESRWLSIEPYVHIAVTGTGVLIYNTVNKTYLVYREKPEITKIADQLTDQQNGYVIRLNHQQLNNPVVQVFISDLRNKYMGDLHEPQWSGSKPFNIVPEPVIKKGLKGLENHLNEITFHVNTCDLPGLKPFRNAYYQFPFPVWAPAPGLVLSPEIIRSVADQVDSLPVAVINFVGSGILSDPLYHRLATLFNKPLFRRKFYVPLMQLPSRLPDRSGKKDYLSLYVTFPVDQQQQDRLELLSQEFSKNPRLELYFVVRDNREVEQATELISRLAFRQTFFKPFLNGKNMQFFREQVFISEEDIKASKPTQNQVFSRLSMNEHDYGKLTVFPDGDVYANVNDEALGNLQHQTVAELVDKELNNPKSWERTRNVVEPCRHCLYRFLCPPVSNYEIHSHKFNFCHIHP